MADTHPALVPDLKYVPPNTGTISVAAITEKANVENNDIISGGLKAQITTTIIMENIMILVTFMTCLSVASFFRNFL